MKFEQAHDSIKSTSSGSGGETASSEKVKLAMFESTLKSLKSNDSIPVFDLENLTPEGRKKMVQVVRKSVRYHMAQKTPSDIIFASKIIVAFQKDVPQENFEAQKEIEEAQHELEPHITDVFEQCVSQMYSSSLKGAAEMQEHFEDYKETFAKICETRGKEIKAAASSTDLEVVHSVFQLLPSLEGEEDFKQDAKTRLEALRKNDSSNSHSDYAELVNAYPKSFFTFEEIQFAAVNFLFHELKQDDRWRRQKFDPELFAKTYHLSPAERNIVISKCLEELLEASRTDILIELVKVYGVGEELEAKATALYRQRLEKGSHSYNEINSIDSLVPEGYKAKDEMIALKRTWALNNLVSNSGILSELRFRKQERIEDLINQFNLTEEFLAQPEIQQKIQDQLCATLGYGNYREALILYERFLTPDSRTNSFHEHIGSVFLSSLEKHHFTFSKGSEDEKLIDILSLKFKQSPEFREKSIGILSRTMRSYEADQIAFTIEKLGFTSDEVYKAKEDAVLNMFTNGSGDRLRTFNNPTSRDIESIEKTMQRIAPDEALLALVRAKLNEIVIRNKSLGEIQSFRFCARFLGISDADIITQTEIKDVLYRYIEKRIEEKQLRDASHIVHEFKLTTEDCKNIDEATLLGGVKWWLSESDKNFKQLYSHTWKNVDFHVESYIELFGITQEQLFNDAEIRKSAAALFLAGQVFYNLKGSDTEKVFTQTFFVTEEDMAKEVGGVLELILKEKKINEQQEAIDKIGKILPELQKGFADRTIIEAFRSKMTSYRIPEKGEYGARRRGYGRENNDSILDYLITYMNMLHTFEAQQKICTSTFEYIVGKGEFELAHNLLEERKARSFVRKEVLQTALLPEYVRLFAAEGEDAASRFAQWFQLGVMNLSDERITSAYEDMFKAATLNMSQDDMIVCSQKTKLSKEFLDSPEIKVAIENVFNETLLKHGIVEAMRLVEANLVDRTFLQTERVKQVAKASISNLISQDQFEDIVALNSQLSLGITSQEIIALYPEKNIFFQKLNAEFPKLAKKCFGSLDVLFSIWPYVDGLLSSDVLEKFPFLIEALQENERFGVKLLLKFESLDTLSKRNIETLYRNKSAIIEERKTIVIESRDFRIAMQNRLAEYRRNPEIVQALRKSGIDVEEWLNHEDEMFFALGKDETLKFSDTIVTPIERIQETIANYTEAVKSVLDEYKDELVACRVPLKDLSVLTGELEKLKAEKVLAEKDGNTKKVEGITKGISAIENQIANLKDIPLFDKILSSIALLNLLKNNIFKAYDDLRKAENLLTDLETDATKPAHEKRKEVLSLKNKIDSAKKEMQEKVHLLGVRLTEFDNNLYGMVSLALGEDRTQSLIQEKNELVAEHMDHYLSDSKTLENIFFEKEERGLDGQHMRIGVWNRNPDIDLYLGNYTDCCIRIDSEHMGAESTIADYLTDMGIQIVSITDEKKGNPIAVAWCWIGHDNNDQIAFVVDNIEADTNYSANYNTQLGAKLQEYLQNYAKKIGAKLVQGTSNNDLVVAKMDSAYFKIGGYNRPSGYYLEGENSRINDGHAELENEPWNEDDDE